MTALLCSSCQEFPDWQTVSLVLNPIPLLPVYGSLDQGNFSCSRASLKQTHCNRMLDGDLELLGLQVLLQIRQCWCLPIKAIRMFLERNAPSAHQLAG